MLFLEDDIDVIDGFFDSVGQWIDEHAISDCHIYPLGANYSSVSSLALKGETVWSYPIPLYYGTQGFVIHREDAISLADYLDEDPYRVNSRGTEWDLAIGRWHKENWPELTHFLTPCPSFVQHIGRDSIVDPRPQTHIFPSWPGPEWTYGDMNPGEVAP